MLYSFIFFCRLAICHIKIFMAVWFNPWVRKISWRREWQPTPVFLLANPMHKGAWWPTVHGIAKSQAWLTNLNIRATHILRLCVSPMAQWVKNLPARQETWVWSLEEEMATCSSIPAWKNSMDRGAWYATLHGVTRVRQNWVTKYAAQILRLPWFTKKVNLLLSVSVVQTCTLIVNK